MTNSIWVHHRYHLRIKSYLLQTAHKQTKYNFHLENKFFPQLLGNLVFRDQEVYQSLYIYFWISLLVSWPTLNNIRCRAVTWILSPKNQHNPLLDRPAAVLRSLWFCDGQHVQVSVLLKWTHNSHLWLNLTHYCLSDSLSLHKVRMILHNLVKIFLAPEDNNRW